MAKRIWKIFRNTLIVILLLAISIFFAIRLPSVQTWITQRVASYLSTQLGTEVQVGRVEIDLWARLVINDIYVEDLHQDTLAYISRVALRNYNFKKESGDFHVSNAEIDGMYFNLKRYPGEKDLNYKFLVDYIRSFNSDTTSGKETALYFSNVKLKNSRFNYINENRTPIDYYGIDWNYLRTANINLDVKEFAVIGDSIGGDVRQLSFTESKGFVLDNLSAQLELVNGEVRLANTFLQTPETDIRGKLNFLFTSVDDFDDFEHIVKMNHELEESTVQMKDLAYFADFFEGYDQIVTVSGRFNGTVSNLKGRDVTIRLAEDSFFSGNFDMEGLPEIDETFISVDIDELTSNKKALEQIRIPPYTSVQYLKVPDNFTQLGQITYKGNFTGFINDFVSYGKIYTAIGAINTDLSLKENPETGDYSYTGKLGTSDFDLGKFYGTPQLGPISSDLEVEGSGTSIQNVNAEFKGSISNIYVNGYNYTNIRADGNFRLKEFIGELFIDDPNLSMDFTGTVNFIPKNPVLDFNAEIYQGDLKALKILEEYDFHSISGNIRARSEGLDLENFVGEISLRDLMYCSGNNEYAVDYLDLGSSRNGRPMITIHSDIADASLAGYYNISEIIPSLTEIVSEIYSGFEPITHEHHTQNFEFDLRVYDVSQITEVFIPKLTISPFTRLHLVLNEPESNFELFLLSDSIRYGNDRANGLIMDIRRPDESFYLTAMTENISTSFGLDFTELAIDARTEKDTVFTSFAWGNNQSAHSGDINGKITVHNYNRFDVVFNQSSISTKNQIWYFRPASTAIIDSTDVSIENFELYSGIQSIRADGFVSSDPTKWLNLNITDLDISAINSFLSDSPKFYGILNGNAAIRDVYGNLIFTNDISLDKFKLNDYKVGDLTAVSTWDNHAGRLRLDGNIEKTELLNKTEFLKKPLSFSGYYTPHDEESPLDIIATINDLDLSFINVFMSPGIMSFDGKTSGEVYVTGKPDSPLLNADASLKDASVFVDYLNTRFFIGNRVGIYPDMFTFDNLEVRDTEGNKGNLVGQVMHSNFEKWSFDLFAEMDKTPLLLMNTTEENNSLYYGKAYATGSIGISGYEDNIDFECYLKTEKGTTLAMPMGNTSEETFENFVRFINTSDTIPAQELNLSGITLVMDVEVTPDAEFKIIFDERVGDVMSGRAKGNLNLKIDNLATFNMYGALEVVKGDYLFTLMNLINKKFSVRPGGTINWYGDPMGAEMNLEAVYKVNASISDIVQETQFQSGQRVPVELEMKLLGKMFNPAIDFDIVLPTVDQMTRSRVNAAISNEQEKNKQAFALLAMNKFLPPPNVTASHGSGGIGAAAGAATGTELLSNQISNWLSQISDDFNLGFKYNPGDEITNHEIALALSTQLFNDKLYLSTNVGVSRNATSNVAGTTNLIGDIRIEYKLTPEGRIRLVVYNESNDYRMAAVQQSPYTQGIGVIYRTEFNTIDEFFKNFKDLLRKKDGKE